MKAVRNLAVLVGILAAAFVSLPWTISFFIFQPVKLDSKAVEHLNLSSGRSVVITSTGGLRLSGWFMPPMNASPTIILVHGRSGNISTRTTIAQRLFDDGFGVLLFDYRGYGASEGAPSEAALSEDTQSAFEWAVAQNIPPSQIIVVGQSLGNAPASDLAARHSVAGLLLVSPFTSLPEAAADKLPWLPIQVIPWNANRYEVGRLLSRVACPIIAIASDSDGLVPIVNARKLGADLSRFQFVEVTGFAHDGMLANLVSEGTITSLLRRFPTS